MRRLQIGFVSAFPPGRRPLSEYAWHLVRSLARNPRVGRVDVFADRTPEPTPPCDRNVAVHRCWTFGGVDQPLAVVRAARASNVDALWFNLHLTSGGNTRSSWCAGLAAPAVAKAARFTTVVTLHNMLGRTDVRWAGPETRWFDRLGAHAATALLRSADVVCVLTSEYADLLRSRYGFRRVALMPHGTLGTPVDAPAQDDARCRTVLAFGHFGSYKRLEPLMEVAAKLPGGDGAVTVAVAGIDSRHAAGYLADMRQRYGHLSNVSFLGYVPEAQVPLVFRRSAVCVLPYATTAGMSGVAIQAAMYGVPIVASDVAGFRSLNASGLKMNFFDWRNADSLKDTIRALLDAPERRREDARHNLAYCRRQTMDSVVDGYLDVIDGALAKRDAIASKETIVMSTVE